MTRGIQQEVDKFVTHMQAQYFPYQKSYVQGALRPIQLWEYVFPEESFDDVLAMLPTIEAEAHTVGLKTELAVLRKALKAKKLPKIDRESLLKKARRIIYQDNVQILGIGTRKDAIKDGREML